MAVPSSLYAEDENARQTLANGTVLKWTRKNSAIYPTANVDTDRSIVYSNWGNEPFMRTATRGFHQWQLGCSMIYPDLGNNQSEGYGWMRASGISQSNPQPRIENLFCGTVLTDGNGTYVWGYNPERDTVINSSGGGDRRYLLDMDINKMIFSVSINARRVSDFENIDYLTNPSNTQLPSTVNITLKQLYDNPDDYLIDSFNVNTCYVYGENTNDHWRTASIKPAFLLHSESTGEFYSDSQYSIFGYFYSNGLFSYDSRQVAAHPVFSGGSSTMPIYHNMNNGYAVGCDENIQMNPSWEYDATGSNAVSNAQNYWGTSSTWNHYSYVNQEFTDIGSSKLWFSYGARAYYNNSTATSYYTDFRFDTRKMIKGSVMLEFLAAYGLYFMSENFDPDTVGLTPETLGDDNRIMLGEMSADGTTTGRWITDIDSYTGPNKDGKTSNPDYDPSGGGGGGGGGYDDDPWHGISFSGVGVGGAGAFAKCYYMTSTELANLRSWMNSNNVPEGFDPMAQIIGLSQVPVSLSGDDNTTVQFVNSSAVYDPGVTRVVDSGVSTQIAMGTPKRYSLGSVNITRRMQERGEPYLDYDCQIELYLPLIGMFSLDTQAVMGRTITAEAVLDPISGTLAAYAYVSRDGQNLPIAYGSTTIGVDLPITAQQYSVARAALKQANAQLGTSLLSSTLSLIAAATAGGKGSGTGAKTATGSTNGLAAAGIREAGADYMKASQAGNVFGDFMQWGRTIRQLSYGNNTAVAGSFGGSTAQWAYPFTAYVKIIRPRYEKPSNYNHSQGVPCVQAKTVGSCTGFIQCIGVDVSGITGATDIELQAIQAALSNGIFAGGGS